jgi:hypothetical protein
MARTRQPYNHGIYNAAYARLRARGLSEAYSRRIASGEARGQTQQTARGKGPHTRPAGYTEASYRKRREETAVLRGERNLTSANRQTIKNWYISRARQMTQRGADWGAPGYTSYEAIADWERDKASWEDAGFQAFERVRDALNTLDTGQLWFEHGGAVRGGDTERNQTVVMTNFIDAINDEYGLQLDQRLNFALLYKPKRPQAEAA